MEKKEKEKESKQPSSSFKYLHSLITFISQTLNSKNVNSGEENFTNPTALKIQELNTLRKNIPRFNRLMSKLKESIGWSQHCHWTPMGSLIFGTSVSEGMTQIGIWARSQKNAEYLHMQCQMAEKFRQQY